eukprot:2179025-Pyramimonas_sp.AAC.1
MEGGAGSACSALSLQIRAEAKDAGAAATTRGRGCHSHGPPKRCEPERDNGAIASPASTRPT